MNFSQLFQPIAAIESIHQTKYKSLWWNLKTVLRPYRRQAVLLMLLHLSVAVLESVGIGALLPLVSILTDSQSSANLPSVFRFFLERLPSADLRSNFDLFCGFLILIFLVKSVLSYSAAYFSSAFNLFVTSDVRWKLLDVYLEAPYAFFLHHKQGRLINDITNETTRVSAAFDLFIAWGSQFFNAVMLYALLLVISWKATVFVTLLAGILFVLVQSLRVKSIFYATETQDAEREMMSLLAEAVAGIQQIKIFSAETSVREMFLKSSKRLSFYTMKGNRLQIGFQPVVEFCVIVILCLSLAALVRLYPGRFIDILPAFSVFLLAAMRLLPLVVNLSRQRLKLYTHIPTLHFISSTIGMERKEHSDVRMTREELENSVKAGISFDRVRFVYPLAEDVADLPVVQRWTHIRDEKNAVTVSSQRKNVLEGISFKLQWGQTVALVGRSGSGKSTIVNLLAKLFDPTEGAISAGDVSLSQIDSRLWRSQIGFVTQDAFVFHGTIRENLLFAKPNSSEDEVRHAAEAGGLLDVVENLPAKWETVVGDRGLMLSGGQRQRLAIARVILRNPKILILDEATSALDYQTERIIKKALATLSSDRIVIVISHRLSVTTDVDHILVLDQGRIAEQGSHEQLMEKKGFYWNLYLAEKPFLEESVA